MFHYLCVCITFCLSIYAFGVFYILDVFLKCLVNCGFLLTPKCGMIIKLIESSAHVGRPILWPLLQGDPAGHQGELLMSGAFRSLFLDWPDSREGSFDLPKGAKLLCLLWLLQRKSVDSSFFSCQLKIMLSQFQ